MLKKVTVQYHVNLPSNFDNLEKGERDKLVKEIIEQGRADFPKIVTVENLK